LEAFAFLKSPKALMYILILITYLGGYAAGPQAAMQEFSTPESCVVARDKALAMIDGLLQANLQTYRGVHKSVSAECVKK
jgi:hypothetical protein